MEGWAAQGDNSGKKGERRPAKKETDPSSKKREGVEPLVVEGPMNFAFVMKSLSIREERNGVRRESAVCSCLSGTR